MTCKCLFYKLPVVGSFIEVFYWIAMQLFQTQILLGVFSTLLAMYYNFSCDCSETVKESCITHLVKAWLTTYSGNKLNLIGLLDVENSLETVQQLLGLLFKKSTPDELIAEIDFLDDEYAFLPCIIVLKHSMDACTLELLDNKRFSLLTLKYIEQLNILLRFLELAKHVTAPGFSFLFCMFTCFNKEILEVNQKTMALCQFKQHPIYRRMRFQLF